MAQRGLARAIAVTFSVVAALFLLFYGVAILLSILLSLPSGLPLPPVVGWPGGAILILGLVLAGWLFLYRRPTDMIRSTCATFLRMFRRARVSDGSGRTEPLTLRGPQRFVRHPLYLSVILLFLGWGLLTASSPVLIEVIPFVLWFGLVQIPFEERELRTLYGDQYAKYSEKVPMLVPFTRRQVSRAIEGACPCSLSWGPCAVGAMRGHWTHPRGFTQRSGLTLHGRT